MQAIDGIAIAAFVDDNGVRHDDFELVVRNGAKLQLNMSRAGATGTRVAPSRHLPLNSTASERKSEGMSYLLNDLAKRYEEAS